MKYLLILLIAACPLFAADVDVTLKVPDSHIATLGKGLELIFPDADTTGDKLVSNAEALAWIRKKSALSHAVESRRLMLAVEESAPAILPAAHQAALTDLQGALARLEVERAKIAP